MPPRCRSQLRPQPIEPLERRQLFQLASSFDIGSPGLPGSYSYNANGTHSLDGSGNGIGGSSDQFRFAYSRMVQDFSVSARVASFSSSNAAAQTGVMIRNQPGTASSAQPMAAVVVTLNAEVQFIYRVSASAPAVVVTAADVVPNYLRLSREGFIVAGSYSMDGITWSALGSPQRLTFTNGQSYAGLAVSSRSNGAYASSSFTNLAIIGGGGDWNHRDIGNPAGGGSVDIESDPFPGTRILRGGGTGIGGTADAFNFTARPLNGDGSAVARVESLTAGAAAGVMIRASDAADAPFAAVLTSAGSVRFSWRTSAGETAGQASTSIAAGPISVRLLRSGNFFQGYYSSNGGATWTRIGTGPSVAVTMPAAAQGGLAVTANTADATRARGFFSGVSVGAIASPGAGLFTNGDDALLNEISRRTASWFLVTQNPTSGLFPDRAHVQAGGFLGGESSAASTGFGLSALAIADSRGWVSDGYERALRTLTFLWNDADMKNPANRGFFYHFVNQTTGARAGNSELSSIDTALLISGVLTAGQYWKGTEVETLAQQIYDRVDWTYMQPDGPGTQLRMGWTPEGGFLNARWDSWSEGPLLYLLAMGSTTHPINAASWYSFARNQSVTTYAGMTFYHASGSPLFTNQYPQGWFDLRGLADRADADPSGGVFNLDPFENSKRHTLAQRRALIDAAAGSDPRFDYYGPNAWGLTASDSVNGYQVFGGPPFTPNVDGTIAPTAPGGSLAFTPRESIDALKNLWDTYPASFKTYGFVDAFNPRPSINWYDADGIGIDQGMILVAAENLRSGLVWRLFMETDVAKKAVPLAFMPNGSFQPPALASSSFSFETAQSVAMTFTQDVSATLDLADIEVINITTGQTIASSMYSLALSNTGRPTTATVRFFNPLAEGNYELRVRSNGVATADGTANVQPLTTSFFVLAGDANRDRVVNFSDLVILAQNYNTTGRTFSQGNFNYSADGRVDFADLVLLAQRYNTQVPAASALTATSTSKPQRRASVAMQIL